MPCKRNLEFVVAFPGGGGGGREKYCPQLVEKWNTLTRTSALF